MSDGVNIHYQLFVVLGARVGEPDPDPREVMLLAVGERGLRALTLLKTVGYIPSRRRDPTAVADRSRELPRVYQTDIDAAIIESRGEVRLASALADGACATAASAEKAREERVRRWAGTLQDCPSCGGRHLTTGRGRSLCLRCGHKGGAGGGRVQPHAASPAVERGEGAAERCVCDSKVLFDRGCQCGGFAREMARRGGGL